MPIELEAIALEKWPFQTHGIAYGNDRRLPLEVLYCEHDRVPTPTQLRSAWKTRQDRRGVPLLLVVLHGGVAYVCGPSGEDPTVYPDLDAGQVERIAQEALEQPTRQTALRSLRDSLGVLEEQGLPGLRNEGFLATHELVHGVPARQDWTAAGTKAKAVLGRAGADLLRALGFTVEPLDAVTNVLRAGDRKTAIAVLLKDLETPEAGSERIPGSLSPVSYALARADEENLSWVVVQHGRKVRLYPARTDIGVGRRGRTETYLECHTGLIADEKAAYLWLLFSADALARDGSLSRILADSQDFAGALASRLRERIYDQVIPRLAEGLAAARGIRKPTTQDLATTYEMAMTVLFRLLFIAYGEDKDLLPYRFNGLYQKRSLKSKAKELLSLAEGENEFGDGDTWWQEIQALFRAVDQGNPSWGVPAYNGGLFSSDAAESTVGAALATVTLPDRILGPALQHLLLVPTNESVLGAVDFRSLSVREFGTIYEGLLESELSVAETNLALDADGAYRPCKKGEKPAIPKGSVYLHNASGARKSTGSYYTKHFAVEHLLDRALEPALEEHLERLDALEDLEAAEAFFDFRVADIAMGSGHFLVTAVDRIEARLSGYLARRPLPVVAQELAHLRTTATEALGEAAQSYPDFEDTALLRRLIARRCIYGVDINEVAVQLARLALWIHTFVPGLPLSLLDRTLAHGNSLVGIARLEEFEEEAEGGNMPLLNLDAGIFLGEARDALARLGRLAEATKAEVTAARRAWHEADAAIAPTRALCDILTASRIEGVEMPVLLTGWVEQRDALPGGDDHKHAINVLQGMNPLHFPVRFPEVFLRERGGFDVILGNPPWEKTQVEEHEYWARHVPGLRGLTQRERETLYVQLRRQRPDLVAALEAESKAAQSLRATLMRGAFPGMGSGHPDLYKAFCWRFWDLIAERGGQIGVVLPRSALSAKGSETLRHALFSQGMTDVTTILNTGRWAFDMEPRYTIALIAITRGSADKSRVTLRGPFASQAAFDLSGPADGASFAGEEVLRWTPSASVPILPSRSSAEVFSALRSAPALGIGPSNGWQARPVQGDLNATTGKPLMVFNEDSRGDYWSVYKGASFDLWSPDTGQYYAWADPEVLLPVLQAKRLGSAKNKASAFSECPPEIINDARRLPCLHPRIAFRDVTRATDTRTVRCALVPPGVILNHKAPFFLFARGSSADEAFLLGVLSSVCFDWYARCFVETSLTFFLINSMPVPRPSPLGPLGSRLIHLSGRLACPDDRFADWAEQVGVECGPLAPDEKQEMIHELDAVVAHLFGLTEKHLVHIFETFHEGWDYQERLDATLRHYRTWRGRA